MAKPCVLTVLIALSIRCDAEETWVIGPNQRDRGAVEELLERASAAGARVWRDGTRFLVAGALGDLARETGVRVEPFTGGDNDDIVQTTDFAPEGSLRGAGEIVTLDHAENAAFLGVSFLLDRVEGVAWASDGTFILDSAYASGSSARALNFARQFGLRVRMAENARPAYELKRPRLGLARADAWVAALLDRYRVPYAQATSGDWRARFDSVVVGAETSRVTWSEFVLAGGTVIRLPVAATSFVKAQFELAEPVAFGMPREDWVRSASAAEAGSSVRPIARFVETGGAAISEESLGRGRVISFAFAPDTYASAKLLLNAVYLGSARKL